MIINLAMRLSLLSMSAAIIKTSANFIHFPNNVPRLFANSGPLCNSDNTLKHTNNKRKKYVLFFKNLKSGFNIFSQTNASNAMLKNISHADFDTGRKKISPYKQYSQIRLISASAFYYRGNSQKNDLNIHP
jgi:hypothetical protein